MFLNNLTKTRRKFCEIFIDLHQKGKIPANNYVLDLDSINNNLLIISQEATKYNLDVFAMAKQFGRNPVVISLGNLK